MEHYRIEQDGGAGGAGDVMRLREVISVERLIPKMSRTGQNTKGMRRVIHIVQIKDNGYIWGVVGIHSLHYRHRGANGSWWGHQD